MDVETVTALMREIGAQITASLQLLAIVEELTRERPSVAAAPPPLPPPLPQGPQVKSDLWCPMYDSSTSLEVFAEQFLGIARVAEWTPEAQMLQVRAVLLGGTQYLSHADTVDGT